MTKYSGPRLTLPIAKIRVHAVEKQLIGYRAACSIFNTSGDRLPVVIEVPIDSADIRPEDILTLYTEVATRANS